MRQNTIKTGGHIKIEFYQSSTSNKGKFGLDYINENWIVAATARAVSVCALMKKLVPFTGVIQLLAKGRH